MRSLADNGVYVYNLATEKMSAEIATGKCPNWISFSPDGKYSSVSNSASDDASDHRHKNAAGSGSREGWQRPQAASGRGCNATAIPSEIFGNSDSTIDVTFSAVAN